MSDLLDRDRKVIWHPYTQYKTAPMPHDVVWAEGSFLYTADGRSLFDAISSWWVILHGHCHPYLIAKVQEQFSKLDQVIFSGFTHQPAVQLAERVLSLLSPEFTKVYYSDNGSTAVEAAIKMSIQYWHNQGVDKKRFLTFRNGYHGDTLGAMSVSQRSVFNEPFSNFMFAVDYVDPPLLGNPRGDSLKQLQRCLEENKDYAAFIFEPLVQGVGGMLVQDETELSDMIRLAKQHEVLCIADEVMTGFGRTGKLFASHYLTEQADFVCLSKGLTGGVLPLAMTVTNNKVFDGFLSDDKMKAYLHGHSFSGNPLACAAGLASLDLLMKKECIEVRKRIAESHHQFKNTVMEDAKAREWFKEVRHIGTILAFEWKTPEGSGYMNTLRDKMYDYFIERGQLLRPLGNVLYILPPYGSSSQDLEQTYSAIMDFGRSYFE